MERKIIWLLVFCIIHECPCSLGEKCKNEPTCKIMRIHGMKVADCYNKDFYSFPKCISTDVEVIELTRNRIRDVTRSDLTHFKYLNFLYLTDNLISNLDEDTFADMDSLSTLDLSVNGLTKLPSTVLQLPSLKSLYLRQNMNINIANAVEEIESISSPLTVLDMSYTSNDRNPADFPDFGTMPLLATMNITGNNYVTITPKHFANLCNLQILYNSNVTATYDLCDCWIINRWLGERGVKFDTLECPEDKNRCTNAALSERDEKIYKGCKELYDQIQATQRLTKVGIGVGIAILVAIVAAILCFLWMRKRRRERRVKKENENGTNQTVALMTKHIAK